MCKGKLSPIVDIQLNTILYNAVMKTCRQCNKTKPLTEFYKRKDRNGIPKPFTQCKECVLAPLRKEKQEKLVHNNCVPLKSYHQYLKEAGLLDYYKKSKRYQI